MKQIINDFIDLAINKIMTTFLNQQYAYKAIVILFTT